MELFPGYVCRITPPVDAQPEHGPASLAPFFLVGPTEKFKISNSRSGRLLRCSARPRLRVRTACAPLAAPPHIGGGSGRRPHSSCLAAVWFRVVVRSYLHGLSSRHARSHRLFLCADARHPARAPGVRPRAQAYRATAAGSCVLWRPLRAAAGRSLVFTRILLLQARVAVRRGEKRIIIIIR